MDVPSAPQWSSLLRLAAAAFVVVIILIGVPMALIVIGRELNTTQLLAADANWITATSAAALCGITGAAVVVALLLAQNSGARYRQSHQVASANLLLQLEDRFRSGEASEVARRLQDGGPWGRATGDGGETGPSDDDWNRLTSYVRLFEPVYLLTRDGSLPMELVQATFGPRISEIVRNKRIVGKIIGKQNEAPWQSFLQFWQIVDPESYDNWTQFMKLLQVVDTGDFNRRLHVS